MCMYGYKQHNQIIININVINSIVYTGYYNHWYIYASYNLKL